MVSQSGKIPISSADKQFFQGFYEDYKGFLFFIANKYAKNPADCEDIVQDSVLRLMCNIASLRELNKNQSAKYIALTVRSAWLDLQKRRYADLEISMDHAVLEALCEQDPLLQQQPSDLQMDLIHLKQSLSPKDWMVLEGKYILGYDQEELAEILGISADSVRMTLSRARARARSLLLSDAEKEGQSNG
ncbi:MAG: sigma-70 family RNA polymerase sigma factor [Oscillospiraceae bacterium]|nr:sigma-70 family RNA polymerase sigma factor [Oscillospiraceae bacterium]